MTRHCRNVKRESTRTFHASRFIFHVQTSISSMRLKTSPLISVFVIPLGACRSAVSALSAFRSVRCVLRTRPDRYDHFQLAFRQLSFLHEHATARSPYRQRPDISSASKCRPRPARISTFAQLLACSRQALSFAAAPPRSPVRTST